MSIPTVAYAAMGPKQALVPFKFSRRAPGPKDVEIDIKYCGVCHSDIHQVNAEWGPNGLFPMVPGHEIVGIVKSVGAQVSRFKPGDRVGVGCMIDSCRQCDYCKESLEQYCSVGANFTYNGKEKDGTTITQGGYSSSIVVTEDFVLRIPANLSLDAAAPLLCAGITTYSPLAHWKAGPGKKVAIVGLGGLGHMALKFASAMGADVTMLSHSDKKKDDAIKFGAKQFYATSDPTTFQKLKNHFDLIICTVSSDIDWSAYLGTLKVDGAMVLLGVPEKPVPLSAGPLIFGRRSLAGSLIGGIAETQKMLDFCGEKNIVSDIEVIPIQDVNKAYERVLKSDVRYRFVIDISSLKKE